MGALDWLFAKPAAASHKKDKVKTFEIDFKDEAFILNLTDDIVEDVAFYLNLNGSNGAGARVREVLGNENPYQSKEAREILKYQLNIALRGFEREKKIHLSEGVQKGQKEHPIVPYLKAYLFEAVRSEIMSPSV